MPLASSRGQLDFYAETRHSQETFTKKRTGIANFDRSFTELSQCVRLPSEQRALQPRKQTNAAYLRSCDEQAGIRPYRRKSQPEVQMLHMSKHDVEGRG